MAGHQKVVPNDGSLLELSLNETSYASRLLYLCEELLKLYLTVNVWSCCVRKLYAIKVDYLGINLRSFTRKKLLMAQFLAIKSL